MKSENYLNTKTFETILFSFAQVQTHVAIRMEVARSYVFTVAITRSSVPARLENWRQTEKIALVS